MSYNYETIKPQLFTEAGVEMLMKIKDQVGRLLFSAGAFTMEKVTRTVTGDSWLMLACLDYLVEKGEIDLASNRGMRQHWVYTKNN